MGVLTGAEPVLGVVQGLRGRPVWGAAAAQQTHSWALRTAVWLEGGKCPRGSLGWEESPEREGQDSVPQKTGFAW